MSQANILNLDAAYRPFPNFSEWISRAQVDTARWNRYIALLENQGNLSPELLARARQMAKRAAALDTGAIEDLYEVDRGFTFTVAFETSAWEATLALKGERVKSLFEAQLHAYDYVLDLATKAEPISEAAIRCLHQEICRAQDTYRVMTAVGPQEQELPKGQYKIHPNHVRTRKGTDHSYAPVDVTPPEMARLVSELGSEAFLAAHPVVQAAYAHYSLVVIHPFADGNGRVARALASAFTYRAISMPIVILVEHKAAYLDSLEHADDCNFQSFVNFMLSRSLDTISLVNESIRSASIPSPKEILDSLNRLYFTRGGFTHEEIDDAAIKFVQLLHTELARAAANLQSTKVNADTRLMRGGIVSRRENYRDPINGNLLIQLNLSSPAPARALVNKQYGIVVPKNAAVDDDLLVFTPGGEEIITARMDEILPEVAGLLKMRAGLVADRVVGEALSELFIQAKASLRA